MQRLSLNMKGKPSFYRSKRSKRSSKSWGSRHLGDIPRSGSAPARLCGHCDRCVRKFRIHLRSARKLGREVACQGCLRRRSACFPLRPEAMEDTPTCRRSTPLSKRRRPTLRPCDLRSFASVKRPSFPAPFPSFLLNATNAANPVLTLHLDSMFQWPSVNTKNSPQISRPDILSRRPVASTRRAIARSATPEALAAAQAPLPFQPPSTSFSLIRAVSG